MLKTKLVQRTEGRCCGLPPAGKADGKPWFSPPVRSGPRAGSLERVSSQLDFKLS